MTPSTIGVVVRRPPRPILLIRQLRDSHGVAQARGRFAIGSADSAQVKSVTGNKVCRVLYALQKADNAWILRILKSAGT